MGHHLAALLWASRSATAMAASLMRASVRKHLDIGDELAQAPISFCAHAKALLEGSHAMVKLYAFPWLQALSSLHLYGKQHRGRHE